MSLRSAYKNVNKTTVKSLHEIGILGTAKTIGAEKRFIIYIVYHLEYAPALAPAPTPRYLKKVMRQQK